MYHHHPHHRQSGAGPSSTGPHDQLVPMLTLAVSAIGHWFLGVVCPKLLLPTVLPGSRHRRENVSSYPTTPGE